MHLLVVVNSSCKLAGIGVSPVSIDEAGAVGEEKQSKGNTWPVTFMIIFGFFLCVGQ